MHVELCAQGCLIRGCKTGMLLSAYRQSLGSLGFAALSIRALVIQSARSLDSAGEAAAFEDKKRESPHKDRRFIDKVRVRATGGSGGAGCDSYIKRSRKGFARPIPDGGHGGQGGDVIIEACPSVRDLQGVKFVQLAGSGASGGSQNRAGVKGKDRVIKVPVGTFISTLSQSDANESIADAIGNSPRRCTDPEAFDRQHDGDAFKEETAVTADLDTPATRIVVARGGAGGRGSVSKGRADDDEGWLHVQHGQPGEEVLLQLELKLLADVGFVGFPNVGKSTLLRALTNAKPKIANYPFTTLQPQLGILEVDHKPVVLADIPGLIAGASQNRGRGFAFLRHVERTRMLAYVLDLSSGSGQNPGPSPLQQLADIQAEVQQYSSALLQKSALIVGNKIDEVSDGGSQAADALRAASGMPVYCVSAKTGPGVDTLRRAFFEVIHNK